MQILAKILYCCRLLDIVIGIGCGSEGVKIKELKFKELRFKELKLFIYNFIFVT